MAAEVTQSSEQELPDLKAQSLTTCEVYSACFETKKGLSSHECSQQQQLGVAESKSCGDPVDLLCELERQKGPPDAPLGLPPSPTNNSNSPKEWVAGATIPGLLTSDEPVKKAFKSTCGSSAEGLAHPSTSPLLKKTPLTRAGFPITKNPEEKSPQLSLSPLRTSPPAQWPQSEDKGPQDLTLDSDRGRELYCQLCGSCFETRNSLSIHARAHLRLLGVSNMDAKGSHIDMLHRFIRRESLQICHRPGQGALGQLGCPSSPSTALSRLPTPPPTKRVKLKSLGMASPSVKQNLSPAGTFQASDVEPSTLDLSTGPERTRDILCEFCGEFFDNRKGLSSHACSHPEQLGVSESESSGNPIDHLYELVRQIGLPDPPLGLPPSPTKISHSPKELVAGTARPALIILAKTMDAPPVKKPFKPTYGSSAKGLAPPYSSPLLKKAPLNQAGSPTSKNPEERSPHLSLSPLPTSLQAQRPESEDKGTQYHTFDSDGGRELYCQLCGAWFETRKGLSIHASAHLRHLGISDLDAKGSPIDVLHGLFGREGIQTSLRPGQGARSQLGWTRSASTALSLLPTSPPAKKAKLKGSGMASPWGKQDLSAAGTFWTTEVKPSPLNLSSGPESKRDIRCEFCGEFCENLKGLSSHARSHLRLMGVTEWYVNGSPIDTLQEVLKRGTQSRPGGHSHPPGPNKKALAKVVGSEAPGSSLEVHTPSDLHIASLAKKLSQPPSSPLGHSPTASPSLKAQKMFSGLAMPSLPKKLKPEQMREKNKWETLPGALHGETHQSEGTSQKDMAPLNLSSRAEPVPDIRCEFCGQSFKNHTGLSNHARSHLRQMGVTEWSVNGSPIDTLREILKMSKPCLIEKEPPAGALAPSVTEDGSPTAAAGAMHSALPLSPLASHPGTPGAGPTQVPLELSLLSPITGAKPSATSYLGPVATKRPLQEDCFLPAEVKAKTNIPTELPFKAKTHHEKTSTKACCELCGGQFENRKALASHARAHLRQFGVTEWSVKGSPIETLSEWIKQCPQKVDTYRSYIQAGCPFSKKVCSAGGGHDSDKQPPLGLAPGALSLVGQSSRDEPGLEADRAADSGERPLATSPPGTVTPEEHEVKDINKFERQQAHPPDASAALGGEEANDLQQKLEEVRRPRRRRRRRFRLGPSRVRPSYQSPLVKIVGKICILKCRFCEMKFRGPFSIQEEWVLHLQQHILEKNFSKADPLPKEPQAPEAQAAAVEAP
ncbi:protein Wiz-like [Acomys russatus]|uniref:protein Wiz-like n=1 Tax=Acomys russatus TaxID=60746 RepID=UPI0021E306BC|nr:protein Wiz-like [Acomys russatus]